VVLVVEDVHGVRRFMSMIFMMVVVIS